MKTVVAAGMMLLVTSLHAADRLVVYVDHDSVVDTATMHRAQYLATRMFARIGVAVTWRSGRLPRGDTAAMVVSLVPDAPERF